ncbi:sel1 repeat family protein [Pelomyxa schiedti]|nr:sel1 repeat family protein [Pelomyxa schiedti]
MYFITTTGSSLVTAPSQTVVGNEELHSHVFETARSTSSLSVNRTRRNEMMMEALLQLQVGNIDSALALVANAFSLFESEISRISHDSGESSRHQWDYLPALLFILCLRFTIDDHVALHQHIPTCLSMSCSRALSSTTMELRTHCMRVLNDIKETSDQQENPNNKEWNDLVSRASLRGNVDHHQQQSVIAATTTNSAEQSWSCMYFVALWMLYCRSGASAAHIFGELSSSHYASTVVTCSVGQIRWCASSVTSLGICYDFGVGGVEKDIHKAVKLYQRAADAGHSTAMFNLGCCYYNGEGVGMDICKAVALYQRAGDAGNCTAINNLGCCYEKGYGVRQDTGKAVELYRRAADAGNCTAMCSLGAFYHDGNGVEKDIHKAVTLYQRAADSGEPQAMYNLGWCFQHGTGVNKDVQKALTLLHKAADAGNAAAMCNLGVCYYNGDGVDKDTHKAVTMYQRAADAGDAMGMNNLAWRYYNGTDGFSKDMHQAMRLWLRAAVLGHVGATAQSRAQIARFVQTPPTSRSVLQSPGSTDVEAECDVDVDLACAVVHNLEVTGLRQQGFQCGLTALVMCADYARNSGSSLRREPTSFESESNELVQLAITHGFSKQGEIFDSYHLAQLGCEYYGFDSYVVSPTAKLIIDSLLLGNPVLIAYDVDKNDSPTTADMRKHHWALVKGFISPLTLDGIAKIQSTPLEHLERDNTHPGFIFTTGPRTSVLDPGLHFSTDPQCVSVIALQGRSNLERVWSLSALLQSNSGILLPHEERRKTGQWVIPEFLHNLKEKAVIVDISSPPSQSHHSP